MTKVVPVSPVAISREEAAAWFDLSVDEFRQRVEPYAPKIRVGKRLVVFPVEPLQAWIISGAELGPPVSIKRRGDRRAGANAEYADVLAGDPCAYCGSHCENVDHIEPRARGGANGWENLTASCGPCNRSKHARPMLLFMLERVMA